MQSLRRLLPLIGVYRWLIAASFSAFFFARLFEASVPMLLKTGIDSIAQNQPNIVWPALGISLAVLLRFIVVTYARRTIRGVAVKVAFDLRQRFYQALQSQGSQFFSRFSIGDMMTRAIQDIAAIQRLVAFGSIMVVIFVFATLIGLGAMLSLSPTLTLLILPPLPVVTWYAWYMAKQMGESSRAVQIALSELGEHVQENLSGIRTIQALAQEQAEIKRFAETNQTYSNAFYRQARINSLLTAVMPSLGAVTSIVILGYGGSLVLKGELSVGSFTAFFMYANMVLQPVRAAGFLVAILQRAIVSTERLFEVFDHEPEIPDQGQSTQQGPIIGAIDIKHLQYHYPSLNNRVNPLVLDIDKLNIKAGETIAIMGRVGAGKSTLLKLLTRLLDVKTGHINIDQQAITQYPLAQLRNQTALVLQDSFLFAQPIASNISYDDNSRDFDDIWQAASQADLAATIKALPEQMQTVVGERGITLSGGQRQRTALARGLIRSAPILLLDDCFSAVDTETEETILSALKQIRNNKTTLLVSHRISTARHADRVLILDQGRIAELGSHQQLLASGGYYAELAQKQQSNRHLPVEEQ